MLRTIDYTLRTIQEILAMSFPSLRLTRLAVSGSGLLALLWTAAPAAAQFIRLGSDTFSGFGISADGSVVVGGGGSAGAFRWTRTTGVVSLGYLPTGGATSGALGVSADGSVIVGYSGYSDQGQQAFRWTQAGGMVGLGDLPGGAFVSYGQAVSADGSVVVGGGRSSGAVDAPEGSEAFRWTQAGGMVGLGDLPGGSFSSWAYDVSADGSVVVGSGNTTASGSEAFRWTRAGGMVGLGFLPGGTSSSAIAVSDDGSVVVGASSGRPFRWTQATGMVALDLLPGVRTFGVRGASGDGMIVVGYYNHPTPNDLRPAIWTRDGTMRDLRDMLVNDLKYDLTGWELGRADSISADGRWVSGFGYYRGGPSEAWLANIAPIPEPSSVALAGLGMAALAGYGWRRRTRQAEGNRREQPTAAPGPP
jgi:probable HAF family extracellular repeat protein